MSFLNTTMATLGLEQALKSGMDLFGLTPKKPIAPDMPSPEQIAAKQDAAAQEEVRRLARGRTSTLLTGSRGLTDLGTTSKVLLGQ